VDPYREPPAPSAPCPRCGVELSARAVGDARVDECTRCGGVFVPATLMTRVTDALDLAPEVIATFPEGETVTHPGGPLYVKCPRCRSVMNRKLFADGSKVVVDMCRGHGVWFDDAELRAVADFVAGGGMERAKRAEAAARAQTRRWEGWSVEKTEVTVSASGLTEPWSFWLLLVDMLTPRRK
jgi:Zn-finger nucleic acid-binding protein